MGTSPDGDAKAAADDEFRYVLPWYFWLFAAWGLVAVVLTIGTLAWVWVSVSRLGLRVPGTSFPLVAANWLFCDVCIIWATARWYLHSWHAHVRVDDAGLVEHPWRGSDRQVAWSDVRELGVTDVFSLGLSLRASRGRHRLPYSTYLQRSPDLVAAIVARAGLTERKETWWGTVYSRPEG